MEQSEITEWVILIMIVTSGMMVVFGALIFAGYACILWRKLNENI